MRSPCSYNQAYNLFFGNIFGTWNDFGALCVSVVKPDIPEVDYRSIQVIPRIIHSSPMASASSTGSSTKTAQMGKSAVQGWAG